MLNNSTDAPVIAICISAVTAGIAAGSFLVFISVLSGLIGVAAVVNVRTSDEKITSTDESHSTG